MQIITISRAAGSIAHAGQAPNAICLLYTSDAADERSSVDLGGRRIIKKTKEKKKKKKENKKKKKHGRLKGLQSSRTAER